MLGIFIRGGGRLKDYASVLIEFIEKFYILKSRGMHKRTENVDNEVQQMSDDEYEEILDAGDEIIEQ